MAAVDTAVVALELCQVKQYDIYRLDFTQHLTLSSGFFLSKHLDKKRIYEKEF